MPSYQSAIVTFSIFKVRCATFVFRAAIGVELICRGGRDRFCGNDRVVVLEVGGGQWPLAGWNSDKTAVTDWTRFEASYNEFLKHYQSGFWLLSGDPENAEHVLRLHQDPTPLKKLKSYDVQYASDPERFKFWYGLWSKS